MGVMRAVDLSKLDIANAAKLCFSTKKILVVEDNYFQQIAHLGIFRVMGYKNNVVFANSGTEALALSEQCDFAVIFISMDLVDIKGIEACKKIRKAEIKKQNCSVIIGMGSDEIYRRDYLEVGMDEFVLKPLTVKSITAMFNTLLPVCAKKVQGAKIC
jgi:CheY-like chemotaxis protein